MPKKDSHDNKNEGEAVVEDEVVAVVEVVPEQLHAFSYPSIGNGVVIMARNQQEADEKAALHPLNQR